MEFSFAAGAAAGPDSAALLLLVLGTAARILARYQAAKVTAAT
jgi:hypothetical protein